MANSIKESAEGVALQVTQPARDARLVLEDSDGDATYRAAVRVYGFDGLLLVLDRDKVSDRHAAELAASTARDTDSMYRVADTRIQHAGKGYQVQLLPAADAGFDLGDRAPVVTAPHALVIHDGFNARLAEDVADQRRWQAEHDESEG